MHPVTNESDARRGALIMAYGSPESPDQIEEYYTHIRRGRPPTEEALADLVGRYEALGGTSTLRRRTADQVGAITLSLQQDQPGRWASALGQKHAAPFVEDGVAHLLDVGVSDIVGLVLAPHYSAASVGQYHDRACGVLSRRHRLRRNPLLVVVGCLSRFHGASAQRLPGRDADEHQGVGDRSLVAAACAGR